MSNLDEVQKILKKEINIVRALKVLEKKEIINSDGGISVEDAIKRVNGCRIEYSLKDNTATIKHIRIGLNSESSGSSKALIITEYGKLYLS